ncbi:MAG: Conserved rane protein, partial [Labilithrix sp.]|nr:Conserved rane protein [Labilithrix sp.]
AVAPGPRALVRRAGSAFVVLGLALAACAPWTARNCARMEKCALVSVNGGWNLAIGTQTRDGGWQEITVPPRCKEVFAEAAKDTCFGEAAREAIARDPVSWIARVPAKLHVTFDYFGAAPWYLHEASRVRFPWRAKVLLGGLEVVASRLLLLAALVAARKLPGPNAIGREAVTGVGLVAVFLPGGGVVAYLACAFAIALVGPRSLARLPLVVPATAAVILVTALTHAVFFGAGRYGLVVVPFVTALAFVRVRGEATEALREDGSGVTLRAVDADQAIAGPEPATEERP